MILILMVALITYITDIYTRFFVRGYKILLNFDAPQIFGAILNVTLHLFDDCTF